jgi:adenosyl cobinamide kinase/adenosyl cobinamide phosphate guanylyltransferase
MFFPNDLEDWSGVDPITASWYPDDEVEPRVAAHRQRRFRRWVGRHCSAYLHAMQDIEWPW